MAWNGKSCCLYVLAIVHSLPRPPRPASPSRVRHPRTMLERGVLVDGCGCAWRGRSAARLPYMGRLWPASTSATQPLPLALPSLALLILYPLSSIPLCYPITNTIHTNDKGVREVAFEFYSQYLHTLVSIYREKMISSPDYKVIHQFFIS